MLMLNISEASQQTGLSSKQIRDYEKYGLLTPSSRADNGYRRYNAQDLNRLHFIHQARLVGFSLQQIAELLALQDNPHRSSKEVKELTAKHIHTLEDQIEHLQNMLARLKKWHNSCHGDNSSECPILDGLGETQQETRSCHTSSK